MAGTSSALVAPRPRRKDRRRSRLVVSGLDAGSDKDVSSLDDSLLLIGLLTVLPRWLVNWVSGGQAFQSGRVIACSPRKTANA